MGRRITWDAGVVSRGAVLTTELNALANVGYSSPGPAFDFTTSLDRCGWLDIVLASLAPAAGAYLQLYLLQSLDGTTYEDAPSSTNPAVHLQVATVNIATGTAAKRIITPPDKPILLPAKLGKFVLYNAAGVALGATGNTVTLYTANDGER